MATLDELFARRAAGGSAYTPVSYIGLADTLAAAKAKAPQMTAGEYEARAVAPLESLLASSPFDPTVSGDRGASGDAQGRLRDYLPSEAFAPLRPDQEQQALRTLRPSEVTNEATARQKFMADNPGATPESFASRREDITGRVYGGGGTGDTQLGSIYTTVEDKTIFDPTENRYRFVGNVPTAARFQQEAGLARDEKWDKSGIGTGTRALGGAIVGLATGGPLGAVSGGIQHGLDPNADVGMIAGMNIGAGLGAGLLGKGAGLFGGGSGAGAGVGAGAAAAKATTTMSRVLDYARKLIASGDIAKAQQVVEAAQRSKNQARGLESQDIGSTTVEKVAGIPTQEDYNRAMMEQANMSRQLRALG